jgi:phenylacetic acid degradation operon negative regulatory protein
MPSTDRRGEPEPGPGRPFDDDVEQILGGPASDGPDLPRRQSGSAPQNLAVTLMADFTLKTRAWVPSAAIVALLTHFEVTVSNARTAISRLARRGVLESDKRGRHTFYRLSVSSGAHIALSGYHLAGHPQLAEKWDRNWTLVAFSLSKEDTARRRALRGQLRWQGFAPLYDGLWVHPVPLAAAGAESLTDLAPGSLTVFRGEHRTFALPLGRNPLDAWDLAGIATRYHQFVADWEPYLARSTVTPLSGPQAFRDRAAVIEQYRLLPLLDPVVPLSLLPPEWPRVRAHETFAAVYDGLAQPALNHVLRVITEVSGAVPDGIGTHTVAEMAAGVGGAEVMRAQ